MPKSHFSRIDIYVESRSLFDSLRCLDSSFDAFRRLAAMVLIGKGV